MNRPIVALLVIMLAGATVTGGCMKETTQMPWAPQHAPSAAPTPTEQIKTGKALFKQHCAVCHPEGDNIIKPHMTIHRDHLASHNITKPADIVKIMRNPGPGMARFDEKAIPEKDAMAIAEYVLNTF